MMYDTILFFHIAAGLLTGATALYAGMVLWQRKSALYRRSAFVLSALVGFEVFSGTVLSVVSPKISALSLCGNIVLYVSLVMCVEVLLIVRMKKSSIAFSSVGAVAPIATSFLTMLAAIAYGF